jgi:uracil-DNA glycosylase
MSKDLAAHLKYFTDLGVTGVNRDPAWRRRVDATAAEAGGTSEQASIAEPADDGVVLAETVQISMKTDVPALSAEEALAALRIEIGPQCVRCKLCELGRSQVVFGVGHSKARLMFVGEAPGEDEDKKGEPFVGRAGQLLTKIIEAIGMTRDQVYIANVIKCRPPGNRNPEPDEVAACEPFLFRQIDVIQPKVIVPLGKFAAQCLLKTMDPITKLRGRQFEYRGAVLIPTFHPAYLLRNPSAKREVWDDMKKVRAILQSE